MLKGWASRRSVTSNFFQLEYRSAQFSKNLFTDSNPSGEHTESDHLAARQWLAKFDIHTIPRNLGQITFSRSSGPGGQNVNKYGSACSSIQEDMELMVVGRVNSKATARFQMKDLISIVPSMLHRQLRRSQYYAPNSESLVIQADSHRKQRDNVDQCFQVLRDLILTAGKITVRGETSPEQKARVKGLYVRFVTITIKVKWTVHVDMFNFRQKAGNEKRLQAKSSHSKKKSARKSRLSD